VQNKSEKTELTIFMRNGWLGLLLGASVIAAMALMPSLSAAQSKQVIFKCPGETMKSVPLTSGENAIDVQVGSDCICETTQIDLEMTVDMATRDLIQRAIGRGEECPSCGALILPNHSFCPSCGEKLDPEPRVRSGYIRCPDCGEAVKPKPDDLAGSFCPVCGGCLRGHLDQSWAFVQNHSSRIKLSEGLPAFGQRSTVRLFCYDKNTLYLYWKQVLRAEMGE